MINLKANVQFKQSKSLTMVNNTITSMFYTCLLVVAYLHIEKTHY